MTPEQTRDPSELADHVACWLDCKRLELREMARDAELSPWTGGDPERMVAVMAPELRRRFEKWYAQFDLILSPKGPRPFPDFRPQDLDAYDWRAIARSLFASLQSAAAGERHRV